MISNVCVCDSLEWGSGGEPGAHLGRVASHLWEGGMDNAQEVARSGGKSYLHNLLIHVSGKDCLKVIVPLAFLSNSI